MSKKTPLEYAEINWQSDFKKLRFTNKQSGAQFPEQVFEILELRQATAKDLIGHPFPK